MAWRSGANAPLDIATPPPPPIPFNAGRPLQHVPGSLSFGFGCGNALNGHPSSPYEAIAGPSAWRTPESTAARAHTQKRRRSSPEADESVEESAVADDMMDIPASPTLTKRRRASSGRTGDETHARSMRAPRKTQSAEVGKLLASLDKPALLSLLHGLMQGNEELTERIYTLLPTPSLESVEHALDAAEAKVRAAIPQASANSAAPIRDQYIWSRVRTSLAELASETASYSSVFSLNHTRNGTMHPATAFTFLHLATMRMIRVLRLLPHTDFAPQFVNRRDHERLESLFVHALPDAAKHSPNTVVHTILPALLRDWDDWLRAVDHGVNQEGRMYGQEVVTSWERGVASLGTASTTLGASRSVEEQVLRATMDQALQQMHAALGWLTGPAHRPAWSLAHTNPMEEVGSLCH